MTDDAKHGKELGAHRSGTEWIGHILVALPIAHLLGAAIYLWSYGTGFGGGITSLFTASDILTTSISTLPFVYAYIALAVIGGYMAIKKINKERTSPRPSQVKRFDPYRIESIVRLIISVLYWAFCAHFGYSPHYLLIALLLSHVALDALFEIICILEINGQLSQNLIVLLGSLILYIGVSMEYGQIQRHAPLSYFERSLTCKGAHVLRTLGENYLVAIEDGSRAIYDKDCKEKLRVPASQFKLALI